jgi:hypothetical protein
MQKNNLSNYLETVCGQAAPGTLSRQQLTFLLAETYNLQLFQSRKTDQKIASKSSQSVQKRHCPGTSRQSCGQAASGALFKRQNWKFVVATGDLQCSKVESRKTDQRNCLPERELSIICALHTSGCHALDRRDLRRGMNGGGG